MSSRQSEATRNLKNNAEISQSLYSFDMTLTKRFLGSMLYYLLLLTDIQFNNKGNQESEATEQKHT